MSLSACAALVERGDPDRFAATLAVPVQRRGDLMTLYAFNLELARAPWVASTPLIAEMRLQWWRDVLVAPQAPAHEVAGPLHDLIGRAGLPVQLLDEMAAARRWDIQDQPFAGTEDLLAYVGQTSGHLMWLAAICLGAPPQSEPALREIGLAAGLANFLGAAAALRARGRRPLLEDSDGAIAALARQGLEALHRGRAAMPLPAPAALAGLTAWQADPILRLAISEPARVREGRLALSPFSRRARLARAALTRRL